MKGSIAFLLGQGFQRGKEKVIKVLRYAIPVILIGGIIAFLCLSQAHAQNCPQATLVDSLDLSGGKISFADLATIEANIDETVEKILNLNDAGKEIDKTLNSLYGYETDESDQQIILFEKRSIGIRKDITKEYVLILATCEKLSGIMVVPNADFKTSPYLYSGVQKLAEVEQLLWKHKVKVF